MVAAGPAENLTLCPEVKALRASREASDLAQSIEDILSPGGLRLLLIEEITRIAGFRSQTQNILASKASNRAFENRGAPGSLADFPRDFRSQPRIFRPRHQ